MGRNCCAVIALALLAGCSSPQMYPLQPGEQIVFKTAERANGFRHASGNDYYRTNVDVFITRPTLVQYQ
jgi:uncharacterized protein YcfL